jgi:TolB-like protein
MGLAFADSPIKRLAVLEIENTCNCQKDYANSLPDFLISELLKNPLYSLVERTKIESAMNALDLETSGLTLAKQKEIGKWLGVDLILLGSFTKLNKYYRLDIRIVDIHTGQIIAATYDQVTYSNIYDLAYRVSQKTYPKTKNATNSRVREPVKLNKGILQVSTKIKLSIFIDRNIPIQKIRLYLNEKLVKESPPLTSINKTYQLLQKELPQGDYFLRIEHGSLGRNGNWKRSLENQPQERLVTINPSSTKKIYYTQRFNNQGEKYFFK